MEKRNLLAFKHVLKLSYGAHFCDCSRCHSTGLLQVAPGERPNVPMITSGASWATSQSTHHNMEDICMEIE